MLKLKKYNNNINNTAFTINNAKLHSRTEVEPEIDLPNHIHHK